MIAEGFANLSLFESFESLNYSAFLAIKKSDHRTYKMRPWNHCFTSSTANMCKYDGILFTHWNDEIQLNQTRQNPKHSKLRNFHTFFEWQNNTKRTDIQQRTLFHSRVQTFDLPTRQFRRIRCCEDDSRGIAYQTSPTGEGWYQCKMLAGGNLQKCAQARLNICPKKNHKCSN